MQIRQENVALPVSPFYIFHETKLQEGERTRIKELFFSCSSTMHHQITTIPRIRSQFACGSGLEQAGC